MKAAFHRMFLKLNEKERKKATKNKPKLFANIKLLLQCGGRIAGWQKPVKI